MLVLAVLAIPASLALPSTRMAAGEACAMVCDHGTGMDCCCAKGGGGPALRRCPSPADGFLHTAAVRAVAPPPTRPVAPTWAGYLALMTAGFILRAFSQRPDPVPKLLS